MIQLTMVAAVAAVIGGIVALAARDSRLVAAGLLLAMIAAPLVASPEPTYTALAFRLLGALLVAYMLWAATRAGSISSQGSFIGLPAEIVAAAAAFCVGWYLVPVKPLAGPLAAQAAGVALIVLAVGPLAGRNMLRSGVAIAVMALGISLLMQAWSVPGTSLGQIVTTALMVGIVGATGLLLSPTDGELVATGAGESEDLGDVLEPAPEYGAAEPDDDLGTAEPDFEPKEVQVTGRARRLGVREPHR
jgi:hypothetical protein